MKMESFDAVHDIQSSFRVLLNSMANPGLIGDLKVVATKINNTIDFNASLIVLAFILLDAEVSFSLIPSNDLSTSRMFHQLTYSKNTIELDADFIFISRKATSTEMLSAISDAKIGSLINPHSSSTIIIEVEYLGDQGGIILSGPGIPFQRSVDISHISKWIEKRNEKNLHYPMGIDLIFVDQKHQIMCIPRTTKISLSKEVK